MDPARDAPDFKFSPRCGCRPAAQDAPVEVSDLAADAASPAAPNSVSAAPDGLYRGVSNEVAVELRIDCDGLGVISGDVWRTARDARHYVASFRTAPGERVAWPASWFVIGQDEHERRSEGTLGLSVDASLEGTLVGRLEFKGPLEGLPVRRAIPFLAQRVGSAFRQIGLEVETEVGVDPIAPAVIDGRTVTIETALQQAGIEVHQSGVRSVIPSVEGGWQTAQLHTLMSDMAQSPTDIRGWDLRLLLLSKSDRRGLLGIMFDSADAFPRQGCAVFASEIRDIPGIDANRKLIQTTIHELGHALNLAHRFERVVGRADSTSFMNYDWRYRGGMRQDEFWHRFAFTFDNDELEFLRHSPLPPLIPGGAPFHSINYWADGNGGYSPYVPEAPLAGWQLTISPSKPSPVYRFTEAVTFRTLLTNRSSREVSVPKFLLDPKAGFIEIVIRRVNAGMVSGGSSGAAAFAPVMQRCFQWDAADDLSLAPGQSMEDDANLTFGSSGFSFAEPGTYDVFALLVLEDREQQRELVCKSNTLRIRIASPRNEQDEQDALDFFTPSVGMYIALGGSPTLNDGRQNIERIIERHQSDMSDPIVSGLSKPLAFDAARSYVRLSDGKFVQKGPNIADAASLVGELLKSTAVESDPLTHRNLRHLANEVDAVAKNKQESVGARAGPQALSSEKTEALIRSAHGMSVRPRKRW